MAKVVPLFSGSKGNSYFVGSGGEGVLIDAGRNCKQLEAAMALNGVGMEQVKAIFVTHEHIDHCAAVRVLAKKYGLDVYGSAGTLRALEMSGKLHPQTRTHVIETELAVGDMLVSRINTPHDAAESCCYRVVCRDGKAALIATDMGVMTDGVRMAAAESDFVVLESNHDIDMLKTGPYPYRHRHAENRPLSLSAEGAHPLRKRAPVQRSLRRRAGRAGEGRHPAADAGAPQRTEQHSLAGAAHRGVRAGARGAEI